MKVTDEAPASSPPAAAPSLPGKARRRLAGKWDWHVCVLFLIATLIMLPLSWALGSFTPIVIDPATEYGITIFLLVSFAVSLVLMVRRDWRRARPEASSGPKPLSRRELASNLGVTVLVLLLTAGIGLNKLSMLWSAMREGPALIRLIPGRAEMEINGTFAFGLTDRVRQFLGENPQVGTVYLTSGGGVGLEGVALANLIRERKLSTYVPMVCLSACTAAFSAGKERWLKDGARLGYHSGGLRFSIIPSSLVSRVLGSPMRDVYLRNGISPAFVDKALSTPFKRVWFPTDTELMAANAITGVVDRYRFAQAGRGRRAGHFSLGQGYWRMMAVTIGSAREKESFDALMASGYDDGLSEGEIVDRVFRRASAIMRRRIVVADDAKVVEAGHILYAAMGKLASSDDAACAAIGAQADLGAAGDVLWEQGFDATRMVVALVRLRVGAEEIDRTLPLPPGQGVSDTPSLHISASCADVMTAYAEALSLPDADAAARLRDVFREGPDRL